MKINAALRTLALAAAAAASLAPVLGHAQDQPQPTLPTVKLTAGFQIVNAEVARTPQQRSIGLMHRERMAPNDGMLFVFEQPAEQCFWMRNTLLPLSIAFLSDDGTIVNIADMQPRSEDSHCSARPVRYALEMNQGWFSKRGLKAGNKLTGAPFGS